MALPLPDEAVLAVTVCAEPCSPLTLGDTPCAHSAPSDQLAASQPHFVSPTVSILILFNKCSSGGGAVRPAGVAVLAAGGQVLAVVGSVKAGGGLHKRTQSGTCLFPVSKRGGKP